MQTVPEYPVSAGIYAQPVPNNLLTHKDLIEQFFNYGVSVIEDWKKTGDKTSLAVFLDGADYHFSRFSKSEVSGTSGDNRHLSLERIRAKHYVRPGHVRHNLHSLTANNTDTEFRKERSRRKLFGHSPLKTDPNRIHDISELACSLNEFWQWHDANRKPILDTAYCSGVCAHEFSQQFMAWAEKKADSVWPEIAALEAQIRELKPGGQYVLVWRIHELLKRYPFLSRLYLLLACVHAKADETEKAIKAVQTGVYWEDRLYRGTGWAPINPDGEMTETALEPKSVITEYDEEQELIWPEHFVFQPRDEAMYHYGDMLSGMSVRTRYPMNTMYLFHRVVWNDKGGCYEFYRLFRKFLTASRQLRASFAASLAQTGLYTLRDYLAFVVTDMVEPESFPLRRELAEILFELYPGENPGVLGKFYCDNLQPANALPYAAYAYFVERPGENEDDVSQSTLNLGCLLYDMGYMDDAVPYLDKAVRVKNPTPMAFLTRGCALIEKREFTEAVHCLLEGLKLDPSSDRFYYNLALAYVEMGKLDEAEQAIKEGIALSKYPVDLNMQLMRIHVKKGSFVDALPFARYVASEDPEMFVNALQYSEFKEFTEHPAVKKLLEECGYKARS